MTEVRAEAGERSPADQAARDDPSTLSRVEQRDKELAQRATRVAARGSKPTRIVSARVSVWLRLREMWRARELFVFLVRKEIKVKYKNSVLGFLWSMLNPALTLAVFYVLFTYFLPNGIPYFVIYMFSAMLVWNLFQAGLLTGTTSVVVNAGIVKKVARLPPWAGLERDVVAHPRPGRHRGLRFRPLHLLVGGERLSARHPAPGGGAAGGLVLGHTHRVRLLGPGA